MESFNIKTANDLVFFKISINVVIADFYSGILIEFCEVAFKNLLFEYVCNAYKFKDINIMVLTVEVFLL